MVLGGGPAGLYFALLFKKADPRNQVKVLERNPPQATFGWGVVFSEETLSSLRDADYESYARIVDGFARWSAIDIYFRDQLVRSRGHVFSGIARKQLLGILQDRCRQLGVELVFREEVTALDQLDGADLVVGADGINGISRRLNTAAFRPRIQTHPTRYIWFGTNRVFDAFTFIFRRNPEGLFQVHAYPFDAHTSTFIVECQEETWRKAGLENAEESESIAYCEELFGPELDGHRLLSNRSLWINFITLRCESWHHNNLVLVGDAAHTAHFSIGSGTKLAMEDSIALVDSLRRIPDLERALTDYEMTRQPVVERFQEAAAESSAYFENVARYEDFGSIRFAFNLLTRSRRITYLNLALRDPQLVASLDAAMSSGANGSSRYAPPPLFSPCRIGSTSLANRLVLTDRASNLPHLAGSGAGLLLTSMVAVSPEGRVDPEEEGLYAAEEIERWNVIVKSVHDRGGAKIGLQLGHAGRRGSMRPAREGVDRPLRSGGWQRFAPSALPYVSWADPPRAMSRSDMQAILRAFEESTDAAIQCGFDLLELNFAQGYLLGSFLSPLSNQRDDGYGGTFSARLTFPMEVFTAVRKRWHGVLAVALLASDIVEGGFTFDDGVLVARALQDAGCDLLRPMLGHTTPRSSPDYNRLYGAAASDRIRNEAGIPTLAAGRITTLDEMNTLIGSGRADLCLLDQAPMS